MVIHSNQKVRDLIFVYNQGKLHLNWGRQLVFFRLVKELKLTEEEWVELSNGLHKSQVNS